MLFIHKPALIVFLLSSNKPRHKNAANESVTIKWY